MSELGKALLEFQSKAPDLRRDATNPHYQSKFLSLEGLMAQVLPIANSAGLVVTQFPTTVQYGERLEPALCTRITHAESGEHMEDVMLLMPDKPGPQAQGSALTYARRYSLMSALGLVADEDDDGNVATNFTAGSASKPSELAIHFGKNKGVQLGSLSPAQLKWYANEWKVQDEATEYDHLLKAAALALLGGDDSEISSDPYPDVPF